MNDIQKLLRKAISEGGRLDATAAVVLGAQASALPQFRAERLQPFSLAGFESEPLAEIPLDPAECDRSDHGVRIFERLSLAARAGQFRHSPSLHGPMAALGLNLDAMPTIGAGQIERALAWAIKEIGELPVTLAPWRGLQLVGCRIVSDGAAAFELTNTPLPFSLAFIGCVFDLPFVANACRLASLDLSGSSFTALQAAHLHLSGDLNLRRTTFLSPVDLSKAVIDGRLEASDMLACPAMPLPVGLANDSDQGMFNLTQATIGGEARLNRARIWGGLSLRGAVCKRSLHLDGAIVASPFGMLQKSLTEVCAQAGVPVTGWSHGTQVESLKDVGRSLAKQVLHSAAWPADRPGALPQAQEQALVALEVLDGARPWSIEGLTPLLRESTRARTSAIRADGLTVAGDLRVENAFVVGRFRMCYAAIQGAVSLAGGVFNAQNSSRRWLNEIRDAVIPELVCRSDYQEIMQARRDSGQALAKVLTLEIRLPQDYAIDFRNSQINSLDCTYGERLEPPLILRQRGVYAALSRPLRSSPLRDEDATATRFNGRIGLQNTHMQGQLNLSGVVSLWRPAGLGAHSRLRHEVAAEIRNAPSDPALPASSAGLALATPSDPLGGCSLLLIQARVDRDVDLRNSSGFWGTDLTNACVGGDLFFSSEHRRELPSQRQIACKGRARDLGGELRLKGAEIRGDVFLLFDHDRGPDIVGDFCRIEGRLDIYPARRLDRLPDTAPEPVRETQGDSFWWFECGHPGHDAKGVCIRCGVPEGKDLPVGSGVRASDKDGRAVQDRSRAHGGWRWMASGVRSLFDWRRAVGRGAGPEPVRVWFITLRNARCRVFGHPPMAWPLGGGLSLEGFRYERASALGPLAPIVNDAHDTGDNWRGLRLRGAFLTIGLIWLALGAASYAGLNYLGVGKEAFWYARTSALPLLALALWPILGALGENRRLRPLALDYLNLHRREFNGFHHPGFPSRYIPTDPYMTASRALRESGRSISADEVDQKRLRIHAEMLSFRRFLPLKAFLLLADWVSGFGYRFGRLVAVVLATAVLAGTLVHVAGREPEAS